MKGLLLKDLYLFKQFGKFLIVALFIFVISSLGLDEPAFFIGPSISILLIMPIITTFSYDAAAKWDVFAITMPLSRKVIVKCKYIELLCVIGASFIVNMLVSFIIGLISSKSTTPFHMLATTAVLLSCVLAILMSIWVPLIFKVGVEKARYIPIVIFGAMFAGISAVSYVSLIELPSYGAVLLIILALTVVSLTISYRASNNILGKKEF